MSIFGCFVTLLALYFPWCCLAGQLFKDAIIFLFFLLAIFHLFLLRLYILPVRVGASGLRASVIFLVRNVDMRRIQCGIRIHRAVSFFRELAGLMIMSFLFCVS